MITKKKMVDRTIVNDEGVEEFRGVIGGVLKELEL